MKIAVHCKYLMIVCLLLASLSGKGQVKNLTVMFYNVENYFDTIYNPLKQDDFTPDDIYEWTHERFVKKRNGITQVIMAIDGDNPPPCLIGLCEVENRFVLQQLIDSTQLNEYDYCILHNDSPDVRGIDVALLYKRSCFRLIDSSFFLMGSDSLSMEKREILYAKGIVPNGDTLHVLVNHFPSKRGGVRKTAPLRMAAARTLRQIIDSILTTSPKAYILAMGDFNDTYNSLTFKNGLQVKNDCSDICYVDVYNLSAQLAENGEGSIKYRNRWQLVDMFLVSGGLLDDSTTLYCKQNDVQIFKPDFLMEYLPASNSYRPKPAISLDKLYWRIQRPFTSQYEIKI